MKNDKYKTIKDLIGNTPMVLLDKLNPNPSNSILLKLEGNNPAGSVKDRAALNMITEAEKNGYIKTGDTIIEATSGNTGIALSMVAAIKGYKMLLIMPDHLSQERKESMYAYGAEIILVSQKEGMEGARDLANKISKEKNIFQLNQFANTANPKAHIKSTAKEIWRDTNGQVTHFVSAMGTTGTIMGVSTYLKEKNPAIKIIGTQPDENSDIPGVRRWPAEYMPKIFDKTKVDEIFDVSQQQAEKMMKKLAKEEGIFAGVSSGASTHCAIEISKKVQNSTIVSIICDRGDRYLSTGVFAN